VDEIGNVISDIRNIKQSILDKNKNNKKINE
jgi:hypothetical protein